MAVKKDTDFLASINPFSFGLPSARVQILGLLVISLIMGMAATALLNYASIVSNTDYILANGALTGIIVIMLPALLTIFGMKALNRRIDAKYITFVTIISTVSYSVFIVFSSITYILSHSYSLAGLIILLGDASLFGWWFFTNKILLGRRSGSVIALALIQPTLNILLYVPYSGRIISLATPFNLLLAKLYAGVFVFLLVSYAVIFIVDRPYRKNYKFHSFDAFVQMLQNWLFDASANAPFGGAKFGKYEDIECDTITLRKRNGKIKAVIFAPNIHFGPSGTIGGSDFPHLLERHVNSAYGVPAYIMHKPVNMDNNPISSAQYRQVRAALDDGIANGRKSDGALTYSISKVGHANVSRIGIGKVSLVVFTRAPRITEDFDPSVALLLREMMEVSSDPTVLVDAHNSRFERAPAQELNGVRFGSEYANEYIAAVKGLGKPVHKRRSVRIGVASADIYERLGRPEDLAEGKMNVIAFNFNGFTRVMVCINGNNIIPSARAHIIAKVEKACRVSCEICTTDTHAVNSLGSEADNVVGSKTDKEVLSGLVVKAVRAALADVEPVVPYHRRTVMKKFRVWGPNNMDGIIATAQAVYGFLRVAVPLLIMLGFIAAAWVISAV